MFRLYIERKLDFCNEAKRIYSEISAFLGITSVSAVRYLNRYDIENVPEDVCKKAANRIFSEPQSDICYFENIPLEADEQVIVWEYLPGQYDQRADSAEQCLSLLLADISSNKSTDAKPAVRCAKLVLLKGNPSTDDIVKIQNYLINPVDSRLANAEKPATLKMQVDVPDDIPVYQGFCNYTKGELACLIDLKGLAMDLDDLVFLQQYFISIERDPTETEIRVLDTYWSDHCRHTTFTTRLEDIIVEDGAYKEMFENSLKSYHAMRTDLYAGKDKPVTLMDMACIGAKYLKKCGKLDDIELSEEINACSIYIDVHCTTTKPDGTKTPSTEKWLLMFKNETHNHPTEIEPFGGAATCIGGAIRDPLSGRAWVYQAMRITGAGFPTKTIAQTREGKLPQIKLTREAASGFSSYGNQIGLTTGEVKEFYHEGFEAKRMELGAVIAASPAENVKREEPENGDVVILVGGGTGRDGIGGATGSSKVHSVESVTTAAAEVQKGNAVEERKIQHLFRKANVAKMIRRCNDFGAGGVAVAVGELAPGLDINLDAVPKKYEGLNGTELAISESQERMAVVVRAKDANAFICAAQKENLNACIIATVTDTKRLIMRWRDRIIVNLDRSFLDTAGAPKSTRAFIQAPCKDASPLTVPRKNIADVLVATKNINNESVSALFKTVLKDFDCCSQRGLCERFDGSIGSASVLFPFGGTEQGTKEVGMVAKIPVFDSTKDEVKETSTVSLMSHGYDAYLASWSPYHGAQIAVLDSLAKIAAMGGNPLNARLTFQEYFERTTSMSAWGKPVAALLGALDAQKAMGTASIGGKDSMSGSFEDIHVPPTLVSFAVNVTDVKNVTSGAFKKANSFVYFVPQTYTKFLTPDFELFKQNAQNLANNANNVRAVYTIGAGGIAEAISKMAFGNNIGINIDSANLCAIASSVNLALSANKEINGKCALCGANLQNANNIDAKMLNSLCIPLYGSFVVETSCEIEKSHLQNGADWILLGKTSATPTITVAGASVDLATLTSAWEEPLAKVFAPLSPVAETSKTQKLPDFATQVHSSKNQSAKKVHFAKNLRPRVLLPVFPGTNCELDMERAFRIAGAQTELFVFRNKTQDELADSLAQFSKRLKDAQILALSGGFSVGDEPDGSGKFIANVLRSHNVADAVMDLLENRDGLALGICNGFQALIKVGLLPYGKITEPKESAPTLTFNTINRHISRLVRTRLCSKISPWAMHASMDVNESQLVPISHGEGRIIMQQNCAKDLFANGQVFTQYVDKNAMPTMTEPDNPNGSAFAIEGLTSPNGRVLGKMGHNERTIGTELLGASNDLMKNIDGNKCQNIFASGVSYFI